MVDCPPVLPVPDMNILKTMVDGIILVVRAEKVPRHAVEMAVESLEKEKLVGIVLNDSMSLNSRYYQYHYDRN